MILIIVVQVTRLTRFVKEVWHETQRLRRTFPSQTEE